MAAIALLGLFHASILVLVVMYVNTDNKGYELDDPGFLVYRNTRVEICASNVTTLPLNCADVLAVEPELFGMRYIQEKSHENESLFTGEPWCYRVACLSNSKVIPSSLEGQLMKKAVLLPGCRTIY